MSHRAAETGHENWYEYLDRIEQVGHAQLSALGRSNVRTNVDFYSGSVYAMMGIPIDIMTPVFAIPESQGGVRISLRKSSPKPRTSPNSTDRKPNT